MTPVIPFNLGPCYGGTFTSAPCAGTFTPSTLPAGTQGPPGIEGPAPVLAVGNVSSLPAGSTPSVLFRNNSAGGYFVDFGIPQGLAGSLTQASADTRYAQLVPANATYRFVTNANGVYLELYNPDTQLWHPFVVRGAAGQEEIAIEPAES